MQTGSLICLLNPTTYMDVHVFIKTVHYHAEWGGGGGGGGANNLKK